jgi:hypothetical protein
MSGEGAVFFFLFYFLHYIFNLFSSCYFIFCHFIFIFIFLGSNSN